MKLYVGEGPRGSNGARSTLHWISVTPSATHNQIGPLWCWFPSGWARARSRPLRVSPMTSPVRLGAYPAAAPTPKGVFNQRFEALFPSQRWSPGLRGLLRSPPIHPGLSVRECGAAGSASGQDYLPCSCHTPPVLVPPRPCESSPPWLPVSAPPTGLDVCFFFYLLGVGLPYPLIFRQFWLCEEALCVYLCRHLGSLRKTF